MHVAESQIRPLVSKASTLMVSLASSANKGTKNSLTASLNFSTDYASQGYKVCPRVYG